MLSKIFRAKSVRTLPSLVWNTKSIWLRAAACWCFGIFVAWNDHNSNFDLRHQVRGPILSEKDITLILISESDWAAVSGPRFNLLRPLKEIGSITDSYYWQEEPWVLILGQLLKYEPKAIGITFFFGDNVPKPSDNPIRRSIFEDPRIIWSSRIDNEGRTQTPRFAKLYGDNVGLLHFQTDFDGAVRNISSPLSAVPNFGAKLASHAGKKLNAIPRLADASINYQGPPGTFRQIPIFKVIEGKLGLDEVKNKIVIIGSRDSVGHQYLSPLGQMSKAEIVANITDNILHDRWIYQVDFYFICLFLLALTVFSIWIIFSYPQLVALIFLGVTGAVIATLSAWTFDSLYFWTPLSAPLAQIGITFVIFQSYQLSRNERRTWQLEQEKIYLVEIEKLKDNFISLISHDLKTPIAKIQGIVDRLLRAAVPVEFANDLGVLRGASQELHRYIQSILRVSKVESQKFELRKDAVDINDIIVRTIQTLTPNAQEKQITIISDLEPLFSADVDSDLMFEVLLNLIENAIKYSPNQGTITVRSEEIDDQIVVTVRDNGEGISPDEKELVWNKFYRGERHGMTTKGTGLGLYLVKYFIELHGGQVFIKSEMTKGTEIGFKIPVSEEAVPMTNQQEPIGEKPN